MLALTVDRYEYMTVDTDAWLADRAEQSDDLTERFQTFCAEYGHERASNEAVTAWLKSLGTASGIHGEDGPFSVYTGNQDTFLSQELGYTFARIEPHDSEADDAVYGSLIIVTAWDGGFIRSAGHAEVWVFNGGDDAEAVDFSSGFARHESTDDETACGMDWILENGGYTLWANGGMSSHNKPVYIIGENDEPQIRCPECGGRLLPFCN